MENELPPVSGQCQLWSPELPVLAIGVHTPLYLVQNDIVRTVVLVVDLLQIDESLQRLAHAIYRDVKIENFIGKKNDIFCSKH